MKRKITALCLVVALLAVAIVGGTMAYFTDTDEAVNVMTMGKISIVQHEQERVLNADGTLQKLQDFTQKKSILPTEGPSAYIRYTNSTPSLNDSYKFLAKTENGKTVSLSNVIDKIVTVENTGTRSAYVRTIFAFEAPDGFTNSTMQGKGPGYGLMRNDVTGDKSGYTYNNTDWKWEWLTDATTGTNAKIVIDGQKYEIAVATHQAALKAGETTIPSLLQYYINQWTDSEDVANFGESVEILVVTQAVQADGFENAAAAFEATFGGISETNHPWLNYQVVTTVDQLLAAAKLDGPISLGADMTLPEVIEATGDLTIVGNGHTLTAPANGTRVVNVQGLTSEANIVLTDVVLDGEDVERGISFYNNSGALNVTIKDSTIKGKYGVNVSNNNTNVTLVVNDTTLEGYTAFQSWSSNLTATFNNCVLTGTNVWSGDANNFATVVINEGVTNNTLTFNNCTLYANHTGTASEWHYLNNGDATNVVYWNDCTFYDNDAVVPAATVEG